jgi:hypothetical protein
VKIALEVSAGTYQTLRGEHETLRRQIGTRADELTGMRTEMADIREKLRQCEERWTAVPVIRLHAGTSTEEGAPA